MKQAFIIDNDPVGFVNWAYGGFYKGYAQSSNRGEYRQDKHLVEVKTTPLVTNIGLGLGSPIYEWIANSWQAQVKKDCGIAVVNPNDMRIVSQWNCLDAYISEVRIPACDSTSNVTGDLTVTIIPNRVEYLRGGGSTIRIAPTKKSWLTSNFRVEIGHLPTDNVVAIDTFNWKMELVEDRDYPGGLRPSIELPDLKLTMGGNLNDIESWMTWSHSWLEESGGDKFPGSLQLLDGLQNELARINFQNMGPLYFGMKSTEANREDAKLFRVGLFCEGMTLEGF